MEKKGLINVIGNKVVFSFPGFVSVVLNIIILAVLLFLACLMIKALVKYLKGKQGQDVSIQESTSLGEKIRSRRIEMNMTQEYLAEKVGVSRQAISKWESGKSYPSTSNLIAIANLLNVSSDDLITGSSKQEDSKHMQ